MVVVFALNLAHSNGLQSLLSALNNPQKYPNAELKIKSVDKFKNFTKNMHLKLFNKIRSNPNSYKL